MKLAFFFLSFFILIAQPLHVQAFITSIKSLDELKRCFEKLFLLSENVYVILKVYYEPGNEIFALFDKFKPAGCNEVEFNTSYPECKFSPDLLIASQELMT